MKTCQGAHVSRGAVQWRSILLIRSIYDVVQEDVCFDVDIGTDGDNVCATR